MSGRLTGRSFTDRPHPHPFTRQRCEGELLEFENGQLMVPWVVCRLCPAIGEPAFDTGRDSLPAPVPVTRPVVSPREARLARQLEQLRRFD